MKLSSKYVKRGFFAFCLVACAFNGIGWDDGSRVQHGVEASLATPERADASKRNSLLQEIGETEALMRSLSEQASLIGDSRRKLKRLERAQAQLKASTDTYAAPSCDEMEYLRKAVKDGRWAKRKLKIQQRKHAKLQKQLAALTHVKSPSPKAARESVELSTDLARNTASGEVSPADAGLELRNIRFEEREESLRVVIQLSGEGNYERRKLSEHETALSLRNVKLPANLSKKFDTSALRGGVAMIDSYQASDGTVLVAKTTQTLSQSVEQTKDGLVWEFKPLISVQSASAPLDRRSKVRVSASDPSNNEDLKLAQNYGKRNTLKGTELAKRRITLDIRDADIHDLLRLLSDEINVSIVASPEVKGNVSLSLKSVPFDQALDIILRTNGLGMRYEGSIIWVAKAETFAEEERRAMEAATVREKLEPLEVRLIPVNYATAEGIRSNVAPLLSERGSVNIDPRTNTLIIKDVAANLNAAEILVNSLDTQTPQVLIEARIVETQANFTKELGVQWGGDGIASAATGNATGIVFPSTIGIAGGSTNDLNYGTSATPNFAVNLPASVGTGSGGAIGMTFGSIGGAINLNIRLSALEEKGFLKIVSSPRVMTLDNVAASIQQGTSIPISVVSAAGTNTVFFDAILSLNVTPHVTRDGNIFLKIKLTKNEPDFGNTGADGNPSILKKEAATELLIPDGDTTVIGGIYTRATSQSMKGIPFLSSIPFLGYFFRSTSETDNRTELLIFITPRIVNRESSIAAGGPGSFIPPMSEGK
ncbi:MAG: type IV pilus secretin PilQ [Bradymonadales bacterium]|jgi:type IV pilus assembly protein PilQ